MNIKHTPAPWHFNPEAEAHVESAYGSVANLVGDLDEEGIANGRLIAAAPDMFGTLDRIAEARDYFAEHGVYPAGTVGDDQAFDDWASDVACEAMTLAVSGIRHQPDIEKARIARLHTLAPEMLDVIERAEARFRAIIAARGGVLGDEFHVLEDLQRIMARARG